MSSVQTSVFPVSTPISFIRAECTDLWRDDCGWSANCCWVRRRLLVVPSGLSDSAISRRVKRALDIVGMPVDSWSGSDFSWRSGCVGAYADFVSHNLAYTDRRLSGFEPRNRLSRLFLP